MVVGWLWIKISPDAGLSSIPTPTPPLVVLDPQKTPYEWYVMNGCGPDLTEDFSWCWAVFYAFQHYMYLQPPPFPILDPPMNTYRWCVMNGCGLALTEDFSRCRTVFYALQHYLPLTVLLFGSNHCYCNTLISTLMLLHFIAYCIFKCLLTLPMFYHRQLNFECKYYPWNTYFCNKQRTTVWNSSNPKFSNVSRIYFIVLTTSRMQWMFYIFK